MAFNYAVAGHQRTADVSKLVHSTLTQVGFLVHPVKSKWQPTQHLQWFGFVIDLALSQLEVPREKLAALQQQIIPAWQLASAVGKIISIGLTIGLVSCFMTHVRMYAILESKHACCKLLTLSLEAQDELRFCCWVSMCTQMAVVQVMRGLYVVPV